MSSTAPAPSLDLDLESPEATAALAVRVAAASRTGDVIALSGELGAGKTHFARAFIRARTGTREDVPSPTFTLVQRYEGAAGAVSHFDLYRLTGPSQVAELGFDEARAEGIVLVEWPERLGPHMPTDRLDIALRFSARPDARRATLIASGDWKPRLASLAS